MRNTGNTVSLLFQAFFHPTTRNRDHIMSETTSAQGGSNLPVFYSPNKPEYQGSHVALWPGKAAAAEGKRPAQYQGSIGTLKVQLWEGNGPRGVFWNVKTADAEGKLSQVGNANAYINKNGFNTLSISLRFASQEEADAAKAQHNIKEAVKPHTGQNGTAYYINVYADVSRKAVQANPEEFKRMGFKTEAAEARA